jgi:hypothetical protein
MDFNLGESVAHPQHGKCVIADLDPECSRGLSIRLLTENRETFWVSPTSIHRDEPIRYHIKGKLLMLVWEERISIIDATKPGTHTHYLDLIEKAFLEEENL